MQTLERDQLAVPEPRRPRPPGRDPLAGLEIDPLRPLNNLLWGWIQDKQHRLTMVRRADEYDHQYGLVAGDQAGAAGARRRLPVAVHRGVPQPARRGRGVLHRDDDTTVIADGFGVLNALKETHLLLTQGAHNQYGDLPWTARHEMLMNQWILSPAGDARVPADADHGRLRRAVDRRRWRR